MTLIGEMFPADPVGIGAMLEPMGLAAGPQVPTREWRDLYGALDCAVVAAIHPFYTAIVREFERPAARSSAPAPVGVDGTAAWLEAIGSRRRRAAGADRRREGRMLCRRSRRAGANADRRRITLSGYEGSELLVARLLIESGAEVPYVGTACPRTRVERADREWLEAHGAHVQYRASLEQDLAAMREVRAGSRDRHHAGGAEGEGARRSRRSTSPT